MKLPPKKDLVYLIIICAMALCILWINNKMTNSINDCNNAWVDTLKDYGLWEKLEFKVKLDSLGDLNNESSVIGYHP